MREHGLGAPPVCSPHPCELLAAQQLYTCFVFRPLLLGVSSHAPSQERSGADSTSLAGAKH